MCLFYGISPRIRFAFIVSSWAFIDNLYLYDIINQRFHLLDYFYTVFIRVTFE